MHCVAAYAGKFHRLSDKKGLQLVYITVCYPAVFAQGQLPGSSLTQLSLMQRQVCMPSVLPQDTGSDCTCWIQPVDGIARPAPLYRQPPQSTNSTNPEGWGALKTHGEVLVGPQRLVNVTFCIRQVIRDQHIHTNSRTVTVHPADVLHDFQICKLASEIPPLRLPSL